MDSEFLNDLKVVAYSVVGTVSITLLAGGVLKRFGRRNELDSWQSQDRHAAGVHARANDGDEIILPFSAVAGCASGNAFFVSRFIPAPPFRAAKADVFKLNSGLDSLK